MKGLWGDVVWFLFTVSPLIFLAIGIAFAIILIKSF